MKPMICGMALLLLLTPALAQQAGQGSDEQGQQAAAQPDASLGMTQAQALAQSAQEQAAEDRAAQNAAQYPAQPSQTPAPDAGPGAGQPPVETGSNQPLPERRVLQSPPAVIPRSEAAAYPVYREQAQYSVGAKLLSPEEIEKKFTTPVGKRYLVVEVGLFPAPGETVQLRTQEFTLRNGNEDQAFFPASPEEIAGAVAPKNGGMPRKVALFPGMGIGYGRGPWGSGVSTNVGVGVGAGGPRPYPRNAADANYRAITQELRDKSLPEGKVTEPVAGYLYFPLDGKRAKSYSLELSRNGEMVTLTLPTPKK